MFNKKILCIITLIVLVILIYFYIKNYNEKFENEYIELTRLDLIEAQKKFEEKQILLEEELNKIKLNKKKITYPEITILKEALKKNDNKLYNIRYDSLSKQDKLNELTKRLNNINYSISSLQQNPQYKGSGELKFY